MQLIVLGSGSGGNAFAIVHDGAMLLLDAGFSPREIERRLRRAGADPRALVAIVITHEHSDHATGAVALAARHRVPLVASMGTWDALKREEACDFLPLGSAHVVEVGPFRVTSCPTSHDAAEPVAIGVTLPDGFSVGAAYDLGRPTQAIRWFLRDRHCLILESNHDDTLLRTSRYPTMLKQRIAGPGGHLSNHDAARLLEELHHDGLRAVVLAHLSRRCNTRSVAHATVFPTLQAKGFRGQFVLAEQDGPMPVVELGVPDQGSLFDLVMLRGEV